MRLPKHTEKIMIGAELLMLSALLLAFAAPILRQGPSPFKDVSSPPRTAAAETPAAGKKDFIKWVDFTVPAEVMTAAYRQDVDTYRQDIHLNWIELLAYLGARYGGDFKHYREKDLTALCEALKAGESMKSLTEGLSNYSYYLEAYEAVLGGLVGEYEIEVASENAPAAAPVDAVIAEKEPQPPIQEEALTSAAFLHPQNIPPHNISKTWVNKYGLKGFLPLARYFPYNEYDDFGVSRSYGFKRQHLGHDMMGQVGTPVIAVESGVVEAMGWNQYGGWRLGIRSFDGKRYYYYAHLRQNYPYHKSLKEGSTVLAGDVIGYMGRTGYSAVENTNNIDTPHLHFGLQLIFDESQKEGNNEIWIDCYQLTRFLAMNRSETWRNDKTKEYNRIYEIRDPAVPK